jgi:hypothetical protein
MKGGFLFNPYHPERITSNEDAVKYFKSNSKFSLLTNSSSASITFKATLNLGVVSPFKHTRSSIFGVQVRTLLFKYFLITPAEFGGTSADSKEVCLLYTDKNREDGRTYIESTTVAQITHEYSIQLEIYQKTYNTISSANEPVCPYPISYSTDLDKEVTINDIIGKLVPDAPDTTNNISIIKDNLYGDIGSKDDNAHISVYNRETDKETKQLETGIQARQKITTLGCIIMEFMEDYITLKDYLKTHDGVKDEGNRALSLAAYELLRAKCFGLTHGDLDYKNIMYKSDHEYITNDDKDEGHKGRALLIDFSRAEINKKEQIKEEDTWVCSQHQSSTPNYSKYMERRIVYDTDTDTEKGLLEFYGKYTFKYIYERRLKSSLKFRKKMIDHFKTFITEEDYTKPMLEPSQSFITLETIQETTNDFIYPFLYPTPEFIGEDGEEFPDRFNELITVFFVSKIGEIWLLQESAKKVLEKLAELKETSYLLPEQLEQTSKKQKTDALPYHKGLVNLLKSVLLRREQRIKMRKPVCSDSESSQGSQSQYGGRLINYDKNHKVYNKRFPHSLRVNQYNGDIRNTLKIKYRQTKKSKPKKSKPKKSKPKKSKRKKRKLTKRKPTKSKRKK